MGSERCFSVLFVALGCGAVDTADPLATNTSDAGTSGGDTHDDGAISGGVTTAGEGESDTEAEEEHTRWTARVFSNHATRIEVWVYADPFDDAPALRAPLEHKDDGQWELTLETAELKTRGVDTIRHPALTGNTDFFGTARWLDDRANDVNDAYLDDPTRHFVGLLLPTPNVAGKTSSAIYFGYNGWMGAVTAQLPPAPPGTRWHLAVDTARQQAAAAVPDVDAEPLIDSATLEIQDRAIVIAVAK